MLTMDELRCVRTRRILLPTTTINRPMYAVDLSLNTYISHHLMTGKRWRPWRRSGTSACCS